MPTNVILEEIIKQITKPSVVVDVGCDHCYLAINLLQQKIATFVYNIDIAKKPLASGISNLRKAKLLDYTKNICNDGFSNLHEKIVANYCVISGIGWKTIIKIIDSSVNNQNVDISNFICVSPNPPNLFYQYLKANKYLIKDEMIFVFKNKPYFLICFNKKNGARIKNIFLGPVLTKKNSKHYIEYLKKHLIKLEKYEKFSQKFNEEKKSIIAYLKNH